MSENSEILTISECNDDDLNNVIVVNIIIMCYSSEFVQFSITYV